jgi:2-desacetyl-2-hydroxyethyl bacteriochlorophyllide A dehydrogenase
MEELSRYNILCKRALSAELVEKKQLKSKFYNENQLIIKTVKTLISPGTELKYFEGKHTDILNGKVSFPLSPPGYSAVGEIVKIKDNERGIEKGDRVLALYGHSNYGTPLLKNVTKIPDGLDYEKAVFGVMGAIALHGVREANIQFGNNILILGLGMIGQLALKLAKLTPAKNIIVADVLPSRLELAKSSGADYCINLKTHNIEETVNEITDGKGCENVIEASGNSQAIISGLKSAAPRGKIVILGSPHEAVALELYQELQKKEITICGSYQPNCPVIEHSYTPWTQNNNRTLILDFLNSGKLDFSELITHRESCRNASKLYHILAEDKNKTMAAIIDWT